MDEEETCTSGDMILPTNDKNTMDRICEQEGSLKEIRTRKLYNHKKK